MLSLEQKLPNSVLLFSYDVLCDISQNLDTFSYGVMLQVSTGLSFLIEGSSAELFGGRSRAPRNQSLFRRINRN